MRILIVEDKADHLYMLETLLKSGGYEVISVANGKEALEKLFSEGADMIISDILMPVMDGFQLCQKIRADDTLKHVPFIFYTATYTDEKDEEFALELGADKFLRKPTEPDEFLKIIKGVIRDVEEGEFRPQEPALRKTEETFELYSERLVKKLEKKMLDLEKEITERKRAEESVKRLNLVLHAIRTVNQLIIREKDLGRLLQGTCDNLTENRGYYNAWIALLDDTGRLVAMAQSGLGKEFSSIVEQLKNGEMTDCMKKAQMQSQIVVTKDPFTTCTDCPLAKRYRGRGGLTVRLEHEGKIYGLLIVSIPGDFVTDEEEQSLFEEVAGDIAYALHAIELEKEREQERERLSLVLDTSLDGFWLCDLKGGFLQVNDSYCEMIGYTREELLTMSISDIEVIEKPEMTIQHIKRVIEQGYDRFETRHRRKDGKILDVEISTNYIHLVEGQLFVFVRDISDRKQAEDALRESEEKYRLLVDNATDAILMLDKERRIVSCNQAFLDLFGYDKDEVEGRSVRIIHQSDESFRFFGDTIYPEVKKVGFFMTEWKFKHRDGAILPVETTTSTIFLPDGSVKGYVAIIRDIRERKRAEEEREKLQAQLQQAQKMEAIGTLAGGIAHDFNNILMAIIGHAELAETKLAADSDAIDNLNHVKNAGNRARRLIQQILAFSRMGEEERIPLSLTPLVKEALKFLKSTLPTSVEIREHIEKDPGVIEADATKVHQIVMNLCTNAAHAMREEGGTLDVKLTRVEVDRQTALQYHQLPIGPHVRLTVTDTGCGMDSETLDHIFDPYFTTKEVGEGTGLGLTVVHGIVSTHGGAITVESEPGKGTTIHVYFPIIEKDEKLQEKLEGPLPTGNERILFVDDEQVIVDLAEEMLKQLGYDVVTKKSSVEALELFRADPGRFDLVITDMTMPKMTGDQLAWEVLKDRPNMPIILCTGFSPKISMEKSKEIGIKAFVMKPLVRRDMANTVRKILDAGRSKV